MDGGAIPPASRASPSSLPPRIASTEHADSPLKKKPRLDSDSPGSLGMSDQTSLNDTSPPPNQSSSPPRRQAPSPCPQTPSKLTVDLRRSRPLPSPSKAANGVHEPTRANMDLESTPSPTQGDTRSEGRLSSPETVSTIEANQASGHNEDPPVVEIKLDDEGEYDDDDDDRVHLPPVYSFGAIGASLIEEFPVNTEEDPVQRLRSCCTFFESNATIDWSILQDINSWVARWLDYAGDRPERWGDLYDDCPEFWAQFAMLFGKLISKRCTITGFQRAQSNRSNAILNFFLSYIRIAGHFLRLDLENIDNILETASRFSDLRSYRHIRNLSYIFSLETLFLGQMLRDKYGIDALRLRVLLASRMLECPENVAGSLLELLMRLSESLESRPFVITTLKPGLSAMHYILAGFCAQGTSELETNQGSTQLDHFSHSALETTHIIEQHLCEAIERQKGLLVIDTYKDLARLLSDALYWASLMNPAASRDELESHPGDFQRLPVKDHAAMLRFIHTFKLLWTCISKGRMELRVFGVATLGVELVRLWEARRGLRPETVADPIIRSTAELLARERVIEYIVSADSHPQLISRSSNILSYSLVARHWTSDMTEAVWNTIALSQDSRIVAAVLEALSNSLNLATPKELLDFCIKIKNLPIKAFDNLMMSFLDGIFRRLVSHEGYQEEQKIMEAYNLCLRLNRDALLNQSNYAEHQRIRQGAFSLLSMLSTSSTNPAERQSVYLDCVRDVQGGGETVSGSLSSITAVLLSHKAVDIVFLIDSLDILTVVVRDLCSYARYARSSGFDAPYFKGLDVRLQLLFETLAAAPSYYLETTLEEDLWRHTIGDQAVNDACRETAFRFLRDFVQGRSHSHPFIDHCIQHYLPRTDSAFFTNELVSVISGLMRYLTRVTPPPSPKEDQVVCDPLGDILWRLVLGSSDETAVSNSILLLSNRQVDKSLFANTPTSSVAATHRAAVERCIAQLKLSSSKVCQNESIRPSDNGEKRSYAQVLGNSDGAISEEQRFIRTLRFLKEFLLFARRNSELHLSQQGTKTPSPEMMRREDDGEELVTLKYETHGKTEIREFQIGANSTYADLLQKLQELTLFAELFIIVGGQRIDLSRDPTHPIKDIDGKGRIIVGQPQGAASLPQTLHKNLSDSPAETAMLSHIEELYNFLDMDPALSSSVYEFLGFFPPPGDIEESVLSGNPELTNLFSPIKRYRTMHTLRTLHLILTEQFKCSRVDPDFVFQAVKAFIGAIVDQDVNLLSGKTFEDRILQRQFVDGLRLYLKNFSSPSSVNLLFDSEALVDHIWDFLIALKHDTNDSCALISVTYDLVINLSTLSVDFARNFRTRKDNRDLHLWLLVDHPNYHLRESICNSINGFTRGTPSSSGLSAQENVLFYWDIIKNMLPELTARPAHSREILSLALTVLSRNTDVINDERAAESNLSLWSRIMLSHDHRETPGQNLVNDFIYGYARLLNTSVEGCHRSKVSDLGKEIAEKVFDKFLYPAFGSPGQAQAAIPVLHCETRKELYRLVLNFCVDPLCFETVALKVSGLMQKKMDQHQAPVVWEHSRILRSSAGYVGLSNLTNTCYMNSLVSQLFMNSGFRQFMMEANLSDPGGSQKLLSATQDLFNYMEHTHTRYANTSDFASSIVPYDAAQIDVSIQMDVDEFYNLVFDRWEGQMITNHDKEKFRSFYGGQMVTQIKSLDCDHVSERSEPFLTISCEVKDKFGLHESLQAYVQGDAMEGDNKYKCEGCGRKLVNAIKKSCLRDVPDNLIFHLKRFDFDLTTLQRSKINDKFEFPPRIDMSPYKYEHLMQSGAAASHDLFDLVGILVHNGTAEAGHYYSYVRASQSPYPHQSERWVEFNDADVSDFDRQKIPDACFGGPWDAQQQFGWNIPKPWNAYMLFYRRVPGPHETATLGPVPQEMDVNKPTSSTADVERLQYDNEVLLRWYCLFDPSHAFFVQGMLSSLDVSGTNQDRALIYRVLQHACDYIQQVASQTKDAPDLEALLREIARATGGSFECQSKLLDFLTSGDETGPLFDMLVRTPMQRPRQQVAEFVFNLVQSNRMRGKAIYGLDVNVNTKDTHHDVNDHGILPRVTKLLADMTLHIGKYARQWEEYLSLWCQIVDLGVHETGQAVSQDMFTDALEILLLTEPPIFGAPIHPRNHENQRSFQRLKRGISHPRLVQLISLLLRHLDTTGDSPEDWSVQCSHFDESTSKFPITRHEQHLLKHVDNNKFGFVMKIIDGWEKDNNAPFAPGQIIKSLLLDAWEHDDDMVINTTINQSIDDYYLEALEIPLNLAVVYCQYCPSHTRGQRIVKSVAEHARNIEKHRSRGTNTDSKDQNGLAFVSFFSEVLKLNGMNTRCAFKYGEEYYPYQGTTFAWAHRFAPALMVFDHQETREATHHFLVSHMLGIIPTYDRKDEEPSEQHYLLSQAIKNLFENCCTHYTWAWNARCSKAALEPLWLTIEKSLEWMENISTLQHESRAYQPLLNFFDGNNVMRRFNEVVNLRDSSSLQPDDDGEDVYGTETENENGSEYEDFESPSDEDTVIQG